MLLQEFVSAMTLLQGSHAFDCTAYKKKAYSFMVWFANETVGLSNSCIRKGYWRCICGAILR